MTRPRVLMDMDGVLVDWTGGVLRLFGESLPHRDIRWNVAQQLGIPEKAFWEVQDRDFWANLEPLPLGLLTLREVEKRLPKENICILTSPCMTLGCYEGKRDWVRKHIPEYLPRFFTSNSSDSSDSSSGKEFWADQNTMLIDDRTENHEAFLAAGGISFLYPQPWNQEFLFYRETPDSDQVSAKNLLAAVGYVVDALMYPDLESE